MRQAIHECVQAILNVAHMEADRKLATWNEHFDQLMAQVQQHGLLAALAWYDAEHGHGDGDVGDAARALAIEDDVAGEEASKSSNEEDSESDTMVADIINNGVNVKREVSI